MHIHTFPSGPYSTNAYLVVSETSKEAAIIDASPGSFSLISPFLKGLKEVKLILTHSHWDHIADVALFSLPVYVHPEDARNLIQPGSDGISGKVTFQGALPSHMLQDGEKIQIGESVWQVIHTPGHTPGGICLYSRNEKVLFSGDTLFRGTYGRVDLPTSDPECMRASLKRILALPPDTVVYPGHGPTTTIGQEQHLLNVLP